jgi:hypothetical protein
MGDNVYLGDRDGVRTPMQWSADRNAGFSRANPQRLYLPVIIDPEYHYETVNVESQQANPSSLLWWMKRLIAGFLVDATSSRRFQERLLTAFLGSEETRTGAGSLCFLPEATLGTTLAAHGPAPRTPELDPTHSVIFYGNQLVLKLLRVVDEGVNSEVEMLDFLAERAPHLAPAAPGSCRVAPALRRERRGGDRHRVHPEPGDRLGPLREHAADLLRRGALAGAPGALGAPGGARRAAAGGALAGRVGGADRAAPVAGGAAGAAHGGAAPGAGLRDRAGLRAGAFPRAPPAVPVPERPGAPGAHDGPAAPAPQPAPGGAPAGHRRVLRGGAGGGPADERRDGGAARGAADPVPRGPAPGADPVHRARLRLRRLRGRAHPAPAGAALQAVPAAGRRDHAALRRVRRLATVPPLRGEVERYYEGYCNGVLWPLFHSLPDQLPLETTDFPRSTERVNERFADAVARATAAGRPRLGPRLPADAPAADAPRSASPTRRIGFFLHIPFPPAGHLPHAAVRATRCSRGCSAPTSSASTPPPTCATSPPRRCHVLGAEPSTSTGVAWQGRDGAASGSSRWASTPAPSSAAGRERRGGRALAETRSARRRAAARGHRPPRLHQGHPAAAAGLRADARAPPGAPRQGAAGPGGGALAHRTWTPTRVPRTRSTRSSGASTGASARPAGRRSTTSTAGSRRGPR